MRTPALSAGIGLLPITEVERLTGIRQATLRAWERRYGFPRPLRDQHGERVYPPEQVERLQAAQRLIHAGARPGRLFAAAALPAPVPARPSAQQQVLIGMLRDYRVADLHAQFQFRLMDLGLRRFVTACLAPLSAAVAAAWQAGELPLRCLRLYRQLASAFLQARLATVRSARDGWPRALLASAAGESDTLGSVMAEAVLTTLEVDCIQLGAGLPAQETAAAASETGAGIVLLDFGTGFPRRGLARTLAPLRAALGPDVALWLAGDGADAATGLPGGTAVIASVSDIEAALAAYRQQASH